MQLQLTSERLAAPTWRTGSRVEAARAAVPGTCWRRQQLDRIASRRLFVAASQAAQATTEPPTAATAADSAAAASVAAASTGGATSAALTYTSFEGNSFRLQFSKSDLNILVDPWLVDRLTFGGLDFVYAGSKRVARPETLDVDRLGLEADFMLLTQGIDDHAHRPTLARLSKTLPVVASASGAAVARSMGFRTVYSLDHGQSLTLCDGRVTITATQGALVGPPWSKREVGFVVRENVEGGTSLYYEPHCDFVAESVSKVAPVDIVVSPPCSQILLGYPLVKGATDNVQLLKLLRPKAYIPLLNAEFDQSGPLADLLEEQGSAEQMAAALAREPDLAAVRVCVPKAAQPMPVEL